MNVIIVDTLHTYNKLFEDKGFTLVSDLEKADLVCFTGGADVSPAMYKAHKHPRTSSNEIRDAKEKKIFDEALAKGIPMVGICRGAQFLNVCSGGEMYQDVTNHIGDHNIADLATGHIVKVSSTHHQMMKPGNNAIIIAVANQGGRREWYEGKIFKADLADEDYEVVFYPHTNSLCFQPHPEFNSPHYQDMKTYFFDCLDEYIFKGTATIDLKA